MERFIVAFCGFSTKFVETLRERIQSSGMKVAFVKQGADSYELYLNRLIARVLAMVELELARDHSVSALLVSGSDRPSELAAEDTALFPALRRLRVDRNLQLSHAGGREIIRLVEQAFRTWKAGDLKVCLKPGANSPALLPLRNAQCKALTASLRAIWDFQSESLTGNLEKYIRKPKGSRGLLIRNLEFKGIINRTEHPVRRCSDSAVCDLMARMRLGHAVPARFEFDVSCVNGLAGRRFMLCDGRTVKALPSTTHLNMRINDDFKLGE